MDILYQFNEAYVPYAGVSIFSLLENNKQVEDINIYIIGEKLRKESKLKIKELIDCYNRNVTFIDGTEMVALIKKLDIPEYRGSYATNLKMFFPLYIKDEVRKLLYIDSDTLILGSLEPLFEKDMSEMALGMVLDSLAVKHKLYVGHKQDEYYYNGGVMLINVPYWNKNLCTQKIIEHVKNTRAHYMAPDQDIINVVLKNYITLLEPKYNLQPIHYRYKYSTYNFFWKQKAYYTIKELNDAVEDPVIVHFFRFLGEFPWNSKSRHPYTRLFDFYLEKSPWNGLEKEAVLQKGVVFSIERWLYRILPDEVFMFLFRISYDYFLWRAEMKSRKGLNHKNM